MYVCMYEDLISICLYVDGKVPGLIYGVDDDRNELKIMVTIEQKVLLRGGSISFQCILPSFTPEVYVSELFLNLCALFFVRMYVSYECTHSSCVLPMHVCMYV